MNTLIGPQQKLFARLDDILAILGTTKTTFFPFLDSWSGIVSSYGNIAHTGTAKHDNSLKTFGEGFFAPHHHVGGNYSYNFSSSVGAHIQVADHANFAFGTANPAEDDEPFSVGAWVLPAVQTYSSELAVLSKYDAVGGARDWKFSLDSSGKPQLELYDDNAGASWTGAADTALAINKLSFVVITYDGVETSPDINFYATGATDGSGATEAGSYLGMQAGAAPMLIGASGVSTLPTLELDGRIAMPFVCGKELSAADVAELYGIERALIGA